MSRFRISLIVCALIGLCIFGWWKSNSSSEKSPANGSTPSLQGKSIASSDEAPGDEIAPKKVAVANDAADFLQTIPDGPLKRGLQALAPALRSDTLHRLRELHVPANDLVNLRVDPHGQFFYVCDAPDSLPVGSEMAGETPRTPASIEAIAVPVTSPPIRHSRPGATRIAYLDFNGHTVTGTAWNSTYGVTTFVCKPYDTDGNTATFSDAEQAAILRIWARVAEDFASFDIDVTTEEPAAFTANTARILITASIDANGQANPEGGRSGGVAYVDVFGKSFYPNYSPAFVYYNSLLNDANVAEAASHEFGHNLGLSHDGTSTLSYYGGHGSGETSWGPIMGTGYNRNVSQWSKGEYHNANNTQDDLAVMAAKLTYRPDDHGDTFATAQPLSVAGSSVAGAGVIERTVDADRFGFTTAGGSVTISVKPFRMESGTLGGNLDLKAELYDRNGVLVALADPAGTLAATIITNLAPGDYTLRVLPTGIGNPQANPPSGYTVYGSLGAYAIEGIVPPSNEPQPVVITTQPLANTVIMGGTAVFTVTATGSTPLSYQWQKGTAILPGQTLNSLTLVGVQPEDAGLYSVVVSNPTGSVPSAAAQLTVVAAAIAPTITTQPASQAITSGSGVTFSVVANGTAPLSYQWRRNGVTIPGATAANLGLPSVTTGEAGNYSVTIANSAGSVTSTTAVLTVYSLPVFSLQPVSKSVVPGGTAVFTATASSLPAPTLRWQRSTDEGVTWSDVTDATGVSGATTGTLTLSALTTGASGQRFRCVATNSVGSVASDPAGLNVAELPPVTAIAAGAYHTLYLKADGTVWATGDNTYGQYGNGTSIAHARPVQVTDNATAVAVGYAHSWVLKADGTVWAAGSNSFGQLGDGTTTDRSQFVQVAAQVSAIAARGYESAFISRDGTLWTTGRNAEGQLGDGTQIQHVQPIAVASNVRAVAMGYLHLLYIDTTNTLHAVGGNAQGQLGDGTTTRRLTPVTVDTGVSRVAAGYTFSAYVKQDGTMWAAGNNGVGQLGDGSTTARLQPVPVATGRTRVSAHFNHLLSSGGSPASLFGSGGNFFGQLDASGASAKPEPVLVATSVVAAEAGYFTSHWVKSDGSTWAVGKNISGQLGDGSTTDRGTPVAIFSGVPALAGTPTGFTASDGSSALAVRLTWAHLPGAPHYEVWRHTVNNSATATRIATDETINFFEDRGGLPGVTYYYWVRAIGLGGAGPFSTPDTGFRVAQGTAPSFVTQPANITVFTEASATFSVVLAGDPVPTIQWQVSMDAGSNWADVSENSTYQGVTSATLRVNHVAANFNGYRYRAVADNTAGRTTSLAATLTVNPAPQPPTITSHPVTIYANENSPASFAVIATGPGPITYQWRRNTVAIPGEVGSTYAIAAAQFANAGSIDVVVTNAAGSTTSNAASLIVTTPGLFTPEKQVVGADPKFYYLDVKTTGSWSVSPTPEWITVTPTSGQGATLVLVKMTAHTGSTMRTGTFSINGVTHTLVQLPPSGLDNWVWRNPRPRGYDLQSIVWNAGKYLAVGEKGTIQSSPDGLSWTLHGTETTDFYGLAFGAGKYVAVGGLGRIRTSVDGETWTARTSGVSVALDGVAWNGSLFVAICGNGAILTSPDGVTWTTRTSGVTSVLRDVVWSNGQFVVVGRSGTILTSPDGVTWTVRASGVTSDFICVSSSGSLWVAAGSLGAVSTSPDGVTWTSRNSGSRLYINAMLWDGSAFVACGTQGGLLTSPDGITWTTLPSATQNNLLAMAWSGQHYVAAGLDGTMLRSTDRSNWPLAGSVTSATLRDVMWSGHQFVAVGDLGAIVTSPDGVDWTARNVDSAIYLSAVDWSGTQFVTVGENRTLLTSPDGVTWVSRSVPGSSQFSGVRWLGGRFIVVGSGNKVATSPDGVTWTTQGTGITKTLYDVAWNGELYVAVGDTGAIFTSADTLAWTQRTSPATSGLVSIAWNGSLFVAVGYNGEMASSPDGINWTKLPLSSGVSLNKVIWNGSKFVAVGSFGYTVYSPDGENWLTQISPNSGTLYGVAFTADRFITIGTAGSILMAIDPTAGTAPQIELQPQSQTATVAGTVNFRVMASGSPAPNYQWFRNAVPLPGATTSTLTLANLSVVDVGTYSATASNLAGSTTSNAASLTLLSGYAAWQLGYFTSDELSDANISGLTADPDGDGLSNLVEYALGLNPNGAETSGLPEVSTTATDWVFTYTRPASRSDLTYAVELSTNLTAWSITLTPTYVSTSGETEIWQATYPLASAPTAFFRLKVTQL